jgi:hypothetical protein
VVEEIIGRLSDLTGAQLRRLEEELRRERQRRASFEGGGEGAPRIQVGATLPLTEVLEYRPHEDGYLQLELRRYVRRDGSARERGPYWYFQYHEGGKRLLRQNPRPGEYSNCQAPKALGPIDCYPNSAHRLAFSFVQLEHAHPRQAGFLVILAGNPKGRCGG